MDSLREPAFLDSGSRIHGGLPSWEAMDILRDSRAGDGLICAGWGWAYLCIRLMLAAVPAESGFVVAAMRWCGGASMIVQWIVNVRVL